MFSSINSIFVNSELEQVEIELTNQTAFSDSQGQSMYWGYEATTMEVGLPEITLSMVQVANDAFEPKLIASIALNFEVEKK